MLTLKHQILIMQVLQDIQACQCLMRMEISEYEAKGG